MKLSTPARLDSTLPAFATIDELLARLSRPDAGVRFGTRDAVELSYAELGDRVRGNALHLHQLGVRRGDRVAISLDSDVEHVVTLLALIALGAVPVSVKPRRGDVAAYAEMLGGLCQRFAVRFYYHQLPTPTGCAVAPRAVAWDAAARTAVQLAFPRARPDDIAVVQFSSGSLGDPKAIPLRHRNLVENLRAILHVDGRHRDELTYNFLPLSHDMGLIGGLLSNLVLQNPLQLTSTHSFLRDPLEVFASRAVGVVPMPNFALRYLARALQRAASRGAAPRPALFGSVRSIYCGAEPIRHETVAALLEVAQPSGLAPAALIFSYGLAEAALIVAARRLSSVSACFLGYATNRQLASVGAPVDATEVLVGQRDGDGQLIPSAPGVEGAIFVRGPGVFTGYLDQPPVVHHGWFDTGDLGLIRGGELYISGRRKDLLILNGENIFPADIEAVAARQPGVRECLVLADDERFYVYAVAEAGAELDADALAASVGAHFGTVPTAVIAGAPGSILRTTSGKPMRQAMLAMLRESRRLQAAPPR
jgi:fatty-acyl-CoA synthase